MADVMRDRFWRSVAVGFVAALFLIGSGLWLRAPISVVPSASAQPIRVQDVSGPFVTCNQGGDVLYVWNLTGSLTAGNLKAQAKVFQAR